MAQFVRIKHPDIEEAPSGPPRVTQAAFELIWQAKGWQVIEQEAAPEVGPSVAPLAATVAEALVAPVEAPAAAPETPDSPVAPVGSEGSKTPAKRTSADK